MNKILNITHYTLDELIKNKMCSIYVSGSITDSIKFKSMCFSRDLEFDASKSIEIIRKNNLQ